MFCVLLSWLVAVVIVFVVASEGWQTAKADSVGEKYLAARVHPHLQNHEYEGDSAWAEAQAFFFDSFFFFSRREMNMTKQPKENQACKLNQWWGWSELVL